MKGSISKKVFFLGTFGLLLVPSLFGAQKAASLHCPQEDKSHALVSKILNAAAIKPDAIIVDNIDAQAFEKEEERVAKEYDKSLISPEMFQLYEDLDSDIITSGFIKNRGKREHDVQKIQTYTRNTKARFFSTLFARYTRPIMRDGGVRPVRAILKLIPEFLHTRDKSTANTLLHSAVQAPTYQGQENMVLELLVEGVDPLALNKNNKKASDYIVPLDPHLKSSTPFGADTIDIIKNYCVSPEITHRLSIIRSMLLEYEEDALKKLQHADQRYNDMLISLERDILITTAKLTTIPKKKNTKSTIATASTASTSEQDYDETHQHALAAPLTAAPVQQYATAMPEHSDDWKVISAKIKLPAHPKTINGRLYTTHALERMAPNTPEIQQRLEKRALAMGFASGSPEFRRYVNPRNVTPQEVERTIEHAQDVTDHGEVTAYSAKGIKVVLNTKGNVVTVIRTAD